MSRVKFNRKLIQILVKFPGNHIRTRNWMNLDVKDWWQLKGNRLTRGSILSKVRSWARCWKTTNRNRITKLLRMPRRKWQMHRRRNKQRRMKMIRHAIASSQARNAIANRQGHQVISSKLKEIFVNCSRARCTRSIMSFKVFLGKALSARFTRH